MEKSSSYPKLVRLWVTAKSKRSNTAILEIEGGKINAVEPVASGKPV